MTSTTRKKTPCFKCSKAAGVFICRGCGKDLCYRHVAEHRQELNKEMDGVVINHDQFQQTITEQETQPNCHPLMKQIDQWEQQSINKIQQAANNVRKELLTIISIHRNEVTKDLINLSKQLNKARDEDDYVETDLKEWRERIEMLKKDLIAAQTIDFGQENNRDALIWNIFVRGASTDLFDRTVGDIQVLENGRVALHGRLQQNGAVRGKGEYSSGQHRLRFKIEQWTGNGDFSVGIVSRNTPIESLLYASNYNNRAQRVYFNSGIYDDYNNNNNNLFYITTHGNNNRKDDIVELFIDCDQRMIRLANERARHAQQINISLNVCPFPWQFFLTLLGDNDRIRLCKENCATKSTMEDNLLYS